MEWAIFVKVLLASQGLFLAALLFLAPEGSHRANFWLASLLGAFVLLTVGDVLEDSRLVLTSPHSAYLFDWLIFSLGPLMWFYLRALLGRGNPPLWSALVHGLPALLALLLTGVSYHLLLPQQQMLALLIEELGKQRSNVDVLTLSAAAITCAYWIAAALVLRRHMERVKQHDVGSRQAGWPFTLLMINLGLWALWIAAFLSRSLSVWLLCCIGFPVSVYIVGYFLGLRQPRLFGDLAKSMGGPGLAESAEGATGAKYAKSGLGAERMGRLRIALDRLIAVEKPYLKNDLTLSELAQRLDTSPHHLSQLLNDGLRLAFFDYINAQRVEEAKRLLSDPVLLRRQILDIAYAAGFNSKAAFNAVFKRHVGLTPSAYRRSLLASALHASAEFPAM